MDWSMPYTPEIICTRHDEEGTNNHRLQIVIALVSGRHDAGRSTLENVYALDDWKGILNVYWMERPSTYDGMQFNESWGHPLIGEDKSNVVHLLIKPEMVNEKQFRTAVNALSKDELIELLVGFKSALPNREGVRLLADLGLKLHALAEEIQQP
ncbi:hypothetical protein KAI46_16270 [bacterium]|nr:hypothetical protein [bacterium]